MSPTRPLALLLLAAATLAQAPAQAHGRWRGGISIGIGVPFYYGPAVYPVPYAYGYPVYPAYPVYVPEPAYQPVPPAPPAAPPAPRPPEPIFYPRQGQTAAQTEADVQACNRWAATQRAALADAGVFHRAVLACMDGRGYSAR